MTCMRKVGAAPPHRRQSPFGARFGEQNPSEARTFLLFSDYSWQEGDAET